MRAKIGVSTLMPFTAGPSTWFALLTLFAVGRYVPHVATWQLDPDVVHLNHGSFGACPTEVLEQQADLRGRMEVNPVDFMNRQYQPALERSRTALAAFVGADEAGLVFVPNATYGVNSALRSVESRLQPGDELLITSHTYNACRNAVVAIAERIGGRVVVADIPFPIVDEAEAISAVLDCVSERTALVLLDHVTSPTALVLPVEQIIAALDCTIITIVDGAHAPGMIDVGIRALGAAFYTANCHKWMCAPKGAGFLWAAEPFREAAVAASISHGFNDRWPHSASRFHAQFDWTGTDDPTARLCVGAAIDVMGSHRADGWSGVRDSNHALVVTGRDLILAELGAAAPAPESMIGSMAAIPLPDDPSPARGRLDRLSEALRSNHGIEVPVSTWRSSPERVLRFSAQQYNSLDDVRMLADALVAELERERPARVNG